MKPDSVPPVTRTEPALNVVDGSLSVKVTTAVSPTPTRVLFEVIATVGAMVSMVITGASADATLGLLTASENERAATLTVPGVVDPGSGVKTAE